MKEKSFVRDALVAFAGAAIYTVFLIIAALILKYFGIDLIDVVKKVSG